MDGTTTAKYLMSSLHQVEGHAERVGQCRESKKKSEKEQGLHKFVPLWSRPLVIATTVPAHVPPSAASDNATFRRGTCLPL